MHEMLRRYWPPEEQILLLTAVLADLETARKAWLQWTADHEMDEPTSSEVGLLAAVARRMPELAPGAPLDPRLSGARRYIWTRTQMTLGTTRPLLAAMRAAGLRLMLLKGAALIAADPLLVNERVLRDIDVLIHPEDGQRGLEIARREGWTRRGARQDAADLRHVRAIALRSSRPGAIGEFDLYQFLLTECRTIGQDLGLWERAVPASLQGIDVLCPSMTDQALATLGQAMLHSGPQPAHWVLDIDPMIRAGRIDWELFLREVRVRRIEMFVAAPLLLLHERIHCPVPPDVLRDLTRPIGKAYLVEFETRATGYGPKRPEQFDAARVAAAARAMRAARNRPAALREPRQDLPGIVRHARLGADERIEIPVPAGAAPFNRLRLEVSFLVWHAGRHALLRLDAPGLALKLIPVARASRKAGGRVRRRVVLRIPACLFAMRRIDVVRLRTNGRLAIRDVVVRWGPPPPAGTLARIAAALRSRLRAG